MVLVPCSTLERDSSLACRPRQEAIEAYDASYNGEVIDQIRALVLRRLSVLDSLASLSQDIVDEKVETPSTYADLYNLGAGTPFALSHGFMQLSVTRPSMTKSFHSSIVYCGASTRPGNGV